MRKNLTLRLRKTRLRAQYPCHLAAALALDTGKIIKNLDRGEHFLQNGIQNFDYLCLQSSDIALQSPTLYARKAVVFF